MKDGVPNKTTVMLLTFKKLNDRAYEMGECAVVVPERADSYNELMQGYGAARNDRYKFYIERHKLLQKMLAEDAAGERS